MTIDHEHLPLLGWFIAGLAIALGLGWALCRWQPREGRVEALLMLLAPASIYVLGVKTLLTLLDLRQADWCSGRLAPAIALLRGYSIYSVDSGPIYNTIYSPLAYLVYLPAGLFRGPTEAVIAGNLIGHLLTLGPILLLCLAPHGDEGRDRSLLFSASTFLGFWKLLMVSILATVPIIHADAPMLGFGALACTVLYARRREARPSTRTLMASAIFASMAVWSKQTSAPLLVILSIWVLLAHGVGPALRLCGCLAASLAATTATFVGAFGLRPLVYNLLEIPRSHPWASPTSYTKGFLILAAEEVSLCGPVLLPLLMMVYFACRRRKSEAGSPREGGWRATLRSHYWMLFAGVAVGMVPTSLVSRIKFGGAFNSFAPVLYYLSAAACVLLLDWHARNREAGLRRINDALKVALLASPFAPLLLLSHELMMQIGAVQSPYANPQEQAYQYALKHPHEAYFPWNPLSTLMAEGRAYHFEYGVFDRDLGGFQPSEAHFREYLPEKLRVVAFPPNRGMEYSMLRLAKEYNRRVLVEGLPGWICYER